MRPPARVTWTGGAAGASFAGRGRNGTDGSEYHWLGMDGATPWPEALKHDPVRTTRTEASQTTALTLYAKRTIALIESPVVFQRIVQAPRHAQPQ